MKGVADDGKGDIGRDDMIVPRVALMQGISAEVMAGLAENAHFFHSVLEADLGETLDIIPVHYSKRWTLWKPRHEGGGVLARASDGLNWDNPGQFELAPYKDRPKYRVKLDTGKQVARDIGLGRWGTLDPDNPDSAPAATLSHVFVCVAPEILHVGPFVVFLQRSAEPVARMLLSKIKVDQAPMFGQVYTMGSKAQSSPSGEFNQYAFSKNGHVADEKLFKTLQEQALFFKETGVKTRDEDEQRDLEDAGGVGAEAGAGKDSKDDKY